MYIDFKLCIKIFWNIKFGENFNYLEFFVFEVPTAKPKKSKSKNGFV